jgi:hypothetical protein
MFPASAKRAVVAAFLVASAVSVWLISPRLSISGPSLIDDWYAISRSPSELSHTWHLMSAHGSRFRPGFEAWNYVQWHTFGSTDLLGPNIWGIARTLLFVGGVALWSFLMLGMSLRRRDGRLMFVPVLLGLAPLLVVTTPYVAVDFARFGPQEPLLMGAMTFGGSLLVLAFRELGGPDADHRKARIAGLAIFGLAFWALGAYQKEISVCMIVLAPFLVATAWPEITVARGKLTDKRRRLITALALVALLPLIHVGVEDALVVHSGETIYGADVEPGAGAVHKAYSALAQMPSDTGSYMGWLVLGVLAAGALYGIVRRRPDWLLIGLLTTAIVCLVWSAQTGVHVSRYDIPTLTPGGVGFCLVLSRLGARSSLTAVALISALVIVSAGLAHERVVAWANDEKIGVNFVDAVTRARATGCPVVITGLDPERTAALPVLSSSQNARRHRARCVSQAFVVEGPRAKTTVLTACRRRGWQRVGAWRLQDEAVRLIRCESLSSASATLLASDRM